MELLGSSSTRRVDWSSLANRAPCARLSRTGNCLYCMSWVVVIGSLAVVMSERQKGGTFVVLTLVAIACNTCRRRSACLTAICLFWASFPPLCWPFYWMCFAPLVGFWRYGDHRRRWALEALTTGFAMSWLAAPFLRHALPMYGIIVQVIAGIAVGLQLLGMAALVTTLRYTNLLFAVPLLGLGATLCEMLRAYCFDMPWLILSMPAAPTPVAQWASYIGPFGVSFLLYELNVLCVPHMSRVGWSRWLPPMVALCAGLSLWLGGAMLASRATSTLCFSALLVQPHRRTTFILDDPDVPPCKDAAPEDLTNAALSTGTAVDLVVWPETALRGSREEPVSSATNYGAMNLGDFCERLLPEYDTVCLVGVTMLNGEGRRTNSALLLQTGGVIGRHDKGKLVPYFERWPSWLVDPWLRRIIREELGTAPVYEPGQPFRVLRFSTKDGRIVHVGVSICFEMYFPWLPQYEKAHGVDAIIHLTNESIFGAYPDQTEHSTWACQYRAIETRTWQLVCANWSRSAVIDTNGKVRLLLSSEAGYLRVERDLLAPRQK
jgi:apolipoprotein N-acyltransferase